MFWVAAANLRGYLVRFILTALAVALGVGFVAGTFVLTDSLRQTFSGLIGSTNQYVDITVRGGKSTGFAQGAAFSQMPLDLGDKISAVDGVAELVPELVGSAVIIDRDNKPVRRGTAPSLGIVLTGTHPAVTIVDGREPTGLHEIVVESETLQRSGYRLGDTARVVVRERSLDVTIVGVASIENNPGATLIYWDLPAATELFSPAGTVGSFVIRTKPDADVESVISQITPLLPPRAEAVTGAQKQAEEQATLDESFGFVNTFLLVFAGVALVVGGFIIVNTFSMLLAQRSRELALLRAVGSSRPQLLATVLFEAALIGAMGAAIGLPFGVFGARAIQYVIRLFGLDFTAELPVTTRTVVVSIVVGIGVTLLSALGPALRATKIPPVAAMRDDMSPAHQGLLARTFFALLFLVTGMLLTIVTFQPDISYANQWLGATAAAYFLAWVCAAAPLVRPIIGTVTAPVTNFVGAIGRLSRGNTIRNPRRTAITATALMIGLALVSTVSVLSASMAASIRDVAQNVVKSELIVYAGFTGYDVKVNDRIAQVPGVKSVGAAIVTPVTVNEEAFIGSGGRGDVLIESMEISMRSGQADAIDRDQIVIPETVATEKRWTTGDVVTLRAGVSEPREITIGGVYRTNPGLNNAILLPKMIANEAIPQQYQSSFVGLINVDGGANIADVQKRVADALKDYVVIEVLTNAEYADAQVGQIQMLLNIVYGLLGLSIVIGILGIINTLAMSVFERTREIGLMRAIGLSKSQLWQLITVESVFTAVFGALLGAFLGILLGIIIQHSQRDLGLVELAIPFDVIGGMFAASAVVGVIAALAPAWWATRLDLLKAIGTD